MKKRNSFEDGIHKTCAGVLRYEEFTYKDFIWFHPPNGMKTSKGQASKMVSMGMRAGVTDLVISFKYITGYVELKAEDGKLQTSQKEFKADCERLGLPYYIIQTDNPYLAKQELEKIMKELRLKNG